MTLTATGAMIFEYDYTAPVDSSFISEIYYNTEHEKLAVVFDSGSTFVYDGVDKLMANDLTTAWSVGSYYDHHIKGKYAVSVHSNDLDLIEFVEVAPQATVQTNTTGLKSFEVTFELLEEEFTVFVDAENLSDALVRFNGSEITVTGVGLV